MGNETLVRVAIATIGFAAGAAGMLFRAGAARARLDQKIEKAIADVNTVGKRYRALLALLNRWADTPEKHAQISDLIEGK